MLDDPGVDVLFASIDPWLVYIFILVMTFGESAAFLGLIFPGEVALVAAAALGVSAGIDPVILGAVAAGGAVAGGALGYGMGRRFGPRLIRWDPIARRLGGRMVELRPMLSGPEAGALVAVARFNQVTRALVPAGWHGGDGPPAICPGELRGCCHLGRGLHRDRVLRR